VTAKATNNDWFEATVETITKESPNVKTFVFHTPKPITNLAGQHYELRLNAENGYQAARLYSAAKYSDGDQSLALTVMRVPDGEVSPYVFNQLALGDQVEIRGPFGKYFTWSPDTKQSIFLIGGGSGIVPLHAIFSAHRDTKSSTDIKLLYSEHTYDDILYKDDLLTATEAVITLTKEWPASWKGSTGRVNSQLIDELLGSFSQIPLCYICGMNTFVNAVADGLQDAGIPATMIRTERFG